MMKRFCHFLVSLTLFWSVFAQAAGSPRYGGSLTIPLSHTPELIDPIKIKTPEESMIVLAIFDTLYKANASGEPESNLLAAEPIVSSDQKTLIFTLLPNLVFHDKSSLNAEHIVNSFQRLAKESQHTWLLADIEGIEEFINKKSKKINGLQILSKKEFSIRFVSAPNLYDLKTRLSALPTAIVKQVGQKLLGSGPFYPKNIKTQELTLLPFFFHAKGRPFLDRLIFRQYNSLLDERTAFIARETWLTFYVPLKKSFPKPNMLTGPEVFTEAYLVSKSIPFTNSSEFFSILQSVFDKEIVIRFGLRDLLHTTQSAQTLLPEALNPLYFLSKGSYAPGTAKSKLASAKSKFAPPSEIKIIYDEFFFWHRGLAEQLREFLVEIDAPRTRGIPLSPSDWQKKKTSFDIAVTLIAPVAPGALGLPGLMASVGEEENAFRLLAKNKHLSQRYAKKQEEVLWKQGKIIPIGHRAPVVSYDPRIKGLSFTPTGILDFSHTWLKE